MTGRSFKVGYSDDRPDKVYKGFDKNFHGPDLDCVVLYTVDGELEVIAFDDSNLRSNVNLIEYLNEEPGQVEILGVYHRE